MRVKEFLKKIIPPFLLNFYHFLLAFLGAIFYFFPSKKIKVVGITGTKGKSTVIFMTEKIFEEAGYKVASISSIKFKIGKKEKKNDLRITMPGRLKLQKFLREAVKENCDIFLLEVTSEGIKQYRHTFIDFNICCFLNLTPEHIEAHGSFENYKKAKLKLFKALEKSKKRDKKIIVNLDDGNCKDFLKFKVKEKIGFTTRGKRNKINRIVEAKNIKIKGKESTFEVNGEKFLLKVPGIFNIENALCAISIATCFEIPLKISKKALEKIEKIEGRMEEIIKKPFRVIIDYAHTPHSLEKVYFLIKEKFLKNKGKLICVLGSAGGGRDKWKRPYLGKIAKKYCQKIIVTNEDPYDEDPREIIEQIVKGAGKKALKILNRREAIKKALSLAEKGDIVIITGKGSEESICIKGGKKIPWSDKKVVLEEFQKIYGKI